MCAVSIWHCSRNQERFLVCHDCSTGVGSTALLLPPPCLRHFDRCALDALFDLDLDLEDLERSLFSPLL